MQIKVPRRKPGGIKPVFPPEADPCLTGRQAPLAEVPPSRCTQGLEQSRNGRLAYPAMAG